MSELENRWQLRHQAGEQYNSICYGEGTVHTDTEWCLAGVWPPHGNRLHPSAHTMRASRLVDGSGHYHGDDWPGLQLNLTFPVGRAARRDELAAKLRQLIEEFFAAELPVATTPVGPTDEDEE